MKCAAELTEMYAIGQEKARLEEELLYKDFIQNAIDFCENTIGPNLEALALEGKLPYWTCILDKTFTKRELVREIKPDGHKYACGDESFSPYGSYLDLTTILNYCEKHCLDAAVTDWTYRRFGCGYQHAYRLRVRLKSPECQN